MTNNKRSSDKMTKNEANNNKMKINDNIDFNETTKFNSLANEWWDKKGNSQLLHIINPARLMFITDHVSLQNKHVLDIGCGGGILTESLKKRGAMVTGIDAAEKVLAVAKTHASNEHLEINYVLASAEQFALHNQTQFDVITCMELLEHVPMPESLIKAAAKLLKPGGHLFFSTINRTFKAYLWAIVGAEYVLQLLPNHTHEYEKFITPAELEKACQCEGLILKELTGLKYNPLVHEASLTEDVSVNYIAYFVKE